MGWKELKQELMAKDFPKCPICKSTEGYDISGVVKNYVQCKSCKAKWRSTVNRSGRDFKIATLSLVEADKDGKTVSLIENKFPIDFWRSFTTTKLRISEIPIVKELKTVFGTPIMEGKGRYYGGHKKFVPVYGKGDRSTFYLTKDYFVSSATFGSPKYQIRIPLDTVQLPELSITKEESQGYKFSGEAVGGAIGLPFSVLGVGTFGGILREADKKHTIVLPYIDENGILQEPRFDAYAVENKLVDNATAEWAKIIYDRLVEIHKKKPKEKPTKIEKAPQESKAESPIDQIKKLAELRDAKIISEKEFQAKKRELLKKI
jgi:hypothetical protein